VYAPLVEDDLIKVTRLGMTQPVINDATSSSRSHLSLLCRSTPASLTLSDDFSQQVVSGVRFAPLLRSPSKVTVIPSKVWDPSIHSTYPTTFKHAIKEILLCSHAEPIQQIRIVKTENVNLAATLPKDIWIKILSFTHRSWFEQPHKVNESFLRQRIVQQQQATQEAKDACADAERRLRLMERERDGYKLLAMRLQLRYRAAIKATKKSKIQGNLSRGNSSRGEEDLLNDLAQAAAFYFRDEAIEDFPEFRRHLRFPNAEYDSDAASEIDEGSDVEENDLNNMEAESDDDESDNNEMVDDDSDADDSEDVTLAASPDTSDGSYLRQMSESIQNQSFFT
jgi:hypothetical protein